MNIFAFVCSLDYVYSIMAVRNKLAVITGCDSGMGRALCSRMLASGYKVLISYIEKNPFKDEQNCIARKMDLRIEGDINRFVLCIEELHRDGFLLEYMIHNAGIACFGPIENLPMKMYRNIFEINYFGLVALSQKTIPFLIESRGTILVNGSLAGRIALPFFSPYNSSKFALEGFCESMRRELAPFGIRTILIEPGSISTSIWNKGLEQDISFTDPKYYDSLIKNRDKMISGGNNGLDVNKSADRVMRILKKRRPSGRYIISKREFRDSLMVRLPKSWLDRAVSMLFVLDYGKK